MLQENLLPARAVCEPQSILKEPRLPLVIGYIKKALIEEFSQKLNGWKIAQSTGSKLGMLTNNTD
jgi:hypothetical protein